MYSVHCSLLNPGWAVVDALAIEGQTDVSDILTRITTTIPARTSDPPNSNTSHSRATDQDTNRATDQDTNRAPNAENDAGRSVLNPKQQHVFNTVTEWHAALRRWRSTGQETPPPEPLFVLVHGPPGTGKTKVANEIAHAIPCASCAPTGIAASLFLNAITGHGLFALPVDERGAMKPLTIDRLSPLQAILDSKDVILLDEVSFVRPLTLHRIDSRCQQIKGNLLPFGGMAVVVSPPPPRPCHQCTSVSGPASGRRWALASGSLWAMT